MGEKLTSGGGHLRGLLAWLHPHFADPATKQQRLKPVCALQVHMITRGTGCSMPSFAISLASLSGANTRCTMWMDGWSHIRHNERGFTTANQSQSLTTGSTADQLLGAGTSMYVADAESRGSFLISYALGADTKSVHAPVGEDVDDLLT